MWFLLLLTLFFGLLFWLPIQVEVDTIQQKYRVYWKGILAIWAVPDEAGLRWFYQIFFWKTEWKSSAESAKKGKRTYKKRKDSLQN